MTRINDGFGSKILALIWLVSAILFLNLAKVAAVPPETETKHVQTHNEDMRAKMKIDQQSNRVQAEATLSKATDSYAAMVKGDHGQVPESVLANARCVAVIPEVMTGAMIVGGSHGVGIASCKNDNIWSQPAFLKLSSVSFGAQIGAKSSDLVLFMVSEQAKAALKANQMTLGADLSVTAGTFDRSLDSSTHQVVAYSRTEGVYAGASISGATISADDDTTAAFYGKKIEFAPLLGGSVTTESHALADNFTALLPK